jgi:hypothetical protein
MMTGVKNIFVLFAVMLCITSGFAQTKKAAIGFLWTQKPEITYYGMYPAAPPETPRLFFSHGNSFSDELLFDSIQSKIKQILPALGFRLIPADSVITKETYKALVKKNAASKTPNTFEAKGYAYAANFALLFNEDGNDPDVMIEAYGSYELDFANPTSGIEARLRYSMTIVGYNSKKKKVFTFKTKNNRPKDHKVLVAVKPAQNAGYAGHVINEDISQKQMECLMDAFKQIDADMPEQIEKVTKFYAK